MRRASLRTAAAAEFSMTDARATTRPVALVTGAARRLGAAIARRLHADGYDLALHYFQSGQDMRALAAELEAVRAGSVLTLQADLAAFDRLPELVAQTVGRFGRLDALVNNASAFTPTPIGSATPAQWDALFASNARAPFFLAQAAAPHLHAAHGAIVNMADIYAQRPLRGHTLYVMAKAALVAIRAAMSASTSGFNEIVWTTTCTSLKKPSGNSGRIGRSIRRLVRVSCSLGLASRLKKLPGILPAAYVFSM